VATANSDTTRSTQSRRHALKRGQRDTGLKAQLIFYGLSFITTLGLVGLVAAVMGTAKRRLTGTAEVMSALDTAMISFDPASVTVSENQRAALALSPDHLTAYLVHTHGDKIVTRTLDASTLTCVEAREGLRLRFGVLSAPPVLLYLPTAMARHWMDIFKVLRHV
jgi:hypothetical protein